MKRTVVSAVVAIVVLACAAAGIWLVLVRSVAATMTAQARLADDVLGTNVPAGDVLARTLRRPGLHVFLIDRRAGIVVENGSNGVRTFPLEPPDAPRDGPPDGPAAGLPRPGPSASFVLWFVRLAPIRIERRDRIIEIAPDVPELAGWLALDALALGLGIVATGSIATVRVAADARRRRRLLEARAAERAAAAERYQRFLAEAGHELRTPLTVMTGYVDILRAQNGAGPLDRRVVDGMHEETSRMRALVEKMMTIARLDSKITVPQLLDVGAAARDAAQTAKRRYPQRDLRVDVEQTASIVIDADDYAAALGNMLENALKYAPRSAVAVRTAVEDGRISTAVTDRGPGIAAADRDAIFERFYRGRGRTAGEGLGIGLAIVKRVADRWHGTVDCRSGDGATVFRLSFPLADEERHDGPR